MKRAAKGYRCSGCPVILAVLLVTNLAACDSYNFSGPQPIDKENIYAFPDELTGVWQEIQLPADNALSAINGKKGGSASLMMDNSTQVLQNHWPGFNSAVGNDPCSFYIIAKHHVSLIDSETGKIIMGAWPKPDDHGNLIYPDNAPGHYQYQKTIFYDTLKRPADTTDNYLIYGNMIYQKDNERFLETGYPFYMDHDTIVVSRKDTITIDLGQNAFLRKLTGNLYALNFRKVLIGDENDQSWWMLILLEKTPAGTIIRWECSSKTGMLDCMFYDRASKSDHFYFDCSWTTAELLRLKKEGYFKKTAELKRLAN